jgi:hypothetical protein
LVASTVCLVANTLSYPQGGGHLWVHLNWALGLRSLGCKVIWLEAVSPTTSSPKLRAWVAALKCHLRGYGLADSVALCSTSSRPLPRGLLEGCLDLAAATEADLMLNLRYDMRHDVVRRFRRSALLDIDPGELQVWMSKGALDIARHDVYFTIGETVGQPGARFPDCGLEWRYTPPCVSLDWWPPRWAPADAPFTTVAHWDEGWMDDESGGYPNGKAITFRPYLSLPRLTRQPLELALDLDPSETDQITLWEHGWRVRDAWAETGNPQDYQRYIQRSRGEFSCVKLHCIRLENAWISDRTLCYLASGKPAIVQYTGPSRFLPDAAGLFRFRDLDEAVRSLDTAAEDYEHQCRLARQLAVQHFDAKKVVGRVLERARL